MQCWRLSLIACTVCEEGRSLFPCLSSLVTDSYMSLCVCMCVCVCVCVRVFCVSCFASCFVFSACVYYSDATKQIRNVCFDYANDGGVHELVVSMGPSSASFSVDGSVVEVKGVPAALADAAGTLFGGRRFASGTAYAFRGTMHALRVHYTGSSDLSAF